MKKTFKRRTINGHNFQLLTLPGTDLFKFEVVNMFGAHIERVIEKSIYQNVYGISHFIEHLGFRATRDYTTEELMEMLKIHGSYNASTDHNRINYWFKTNTERAATAINLVCNYAFNDLTKISEEEFETEKKVVYNEAKRYADDDQTMFYFNMETTACGYHPEDNVIGIPETIDTFTLADAIEVKRIFLELGNRGCQTFNITYDPSVISEEEVIGLVEHELKTWTIETDDDRLDNIFKDYINRLGQPCIGEFTIPNESEQAMTAIMMDVIDTDIIAARLGNGFLTSYSKSSLNDLIREKNGLTYGVHLYEDTIAYYPYTLFACDVTRGTEDLMMSLFEQSINESADAFDEDEYNKLMDTIRLKRTLSFIDQQKYDAFHWMSIMYPYLVEKYKEWYENDLDDAYNKLELEVASYESIKNYIERVRSAVNTKTYSILTNKGIE